MPSQVSASAVEAGYSQPGAAAPQVDRTGRALTDDADALPRLAAAPWRRLVVLGDVAARGSGGRVDRRTGGTCDWVELVTTAVRSTQPELAVLDLSRRDVAVTDLRAQQLIPALAFQPQLAIVGCGHHDLLREAFDADVVEVELARVVAALRVARELGPDDVVVVLLPDSGRGYLSKIFNDEWMIDYGFLD
nr:hypothetical protein [Micromonospora sp. DSM 115978]